MRNSQCVKHFRGHPFVPKRREVHSVAIPQPRIAKLAEPPEVDEPQTDIVGDASEKLVVNGGATPQPAEQRHGAKVTRGECEHEGTGLLQCLEPVGVAGHHGVDIVAHQKQIVHARIDGDEVGFEHDRRLNLFGEDLIHPSAADGEVGVAKIGIALRKPDGDVVSPSAQTIGTGGVGIADPLGERVAKCHIPAERCRRSRRSHKGHGINLADTMAVRTSQRCRWLNRLQLSDDCSRSGNRDYTPNSLTPAQRHTTAATKVSGTVNNPTRVNAT